MPQSEQPVQDDISQTPAAPAQAAAVKPAQPEPQKSHKRTSGLWAFDVLLYPLITNLAVFGLSVYATYRTNYSKDNNWFKRRGDYMKNLTSEKLGWTGKTNEMAIMVLFSFLDGSILAPLVKLFEDRRGKISHWIDKKLGTVPKDGGVYEQEPRQGWLSVLGGRLATCLIVVPTAVLLNQPLNKNPNSSLNDIMFRNPAQRLVSANPGLVRRFPRFDMNGLAKTVFFEAFYTSVCTLGLYVSSRLFARRLNQIGQRIDEKIIKDAQGVPLTNEATVKTEPTAGTPEMQATVANDTGKPVGPRTAALMGVEPMPLKPVVGDVTQMIAEQQSKTANSQQQMHGVA